MTRMGHWTKQVLSLWWMEAQRVSLRSIVFYQISSRKDKIASNAGLIVGLQKNVTYHCKRTEEITSLLITDFIVTTMKEP